MPDNQEDVPLPILTDAPVEPAPEPFAPEQMVRCEECLRANPPTRVNCLYCGAAMPLNETTAALQKPALRPLEKWELGYNNILLPSATNPVGSLDEATLREVSDLLRLRPADLSKILAAGTSLPLARAASSDEALLVQRRLNSLGIETCIVADSEPGTDATGPIRVRAIELYDAGLYAFQSPESPAVSIVWSDIMLLVAGRLIVKRVELKEQKGARAENRILDSSEFVTDETVVDFYTRKQTATFRVAANSFDFSCLGPQKTLVAGENISRLLNLFREHAPHAAYDDSFNSVRKSLEIVWPSEQQNESGGWRRLRPGKYSIGSATELSNEMQFLRYSRLRYHFQAEAGARADDNA